MIRKFMIRNFMLGIVALVGLIYGYINYVAYPTIYFRYKLTVEVQTPDGIKSGSVVNETDEDFVMFGREFLPGKTMGLSRGEALFMDLGNGKNLVITNFADDKRSKSTEADDYSLDSGILPFLFCDLPGASRDCLSNPSGVRQAIANARKHGPFAISTKRLPTLLTFSDASDYKTMQRVDPEHVDDVLGSGFAIKSTLVEITDEPLTELIESKLPWLGQYRANTQTFTQRGLNIESSKHSYVTFKEPSKS